MVILQKYIGVTSGFFILYFLNFIGSTEALAIYIALQALNELIPVIDSGNRVKAIEVGRSHIYNLGLPLLVGLFIILCSTISLHVFETPKSIWVYCLVAMCFSYPLNIASFVNLYDKQFLPFSIPIILSYIFNWSLAIICWLFEFTMLYSILSFIILPTIAGGFIGFWRVQFSFKIAFKDVSLGMKASLLYVCSFFGISSVFILYIDTPDIALLGITIKVLSITNLLAQNSNLFASEFRHKTPSFKISTLIAIVGQSIFSAVTLYIVVYFAFDNYLLYFTHAYFSFCVLFVLGITVAARYGASLLANGHLAFYLIVEAIALIIALTLRLVWLHDTALQLLISINIFIFASCAIFLVGSKSHGT